MPESTATGQAPANAASPTALNEGEQKPTISVEDFQGLKKTVDSLAKMFRVQREASQQPSPVTAEEGDDEPKTQKEKLEQMQRELKSQRDAFEKDKAEAAREKREGLVRAIIAKQTDVDPEAQDLLFDAIDRAHGAKMVVKGGKAVVTDDLGDERDVSDVLDEFLKSPKGRFFKVQKAPGPNTRPGRGTPSAPIPGQKSVMEMSHSELIELEKKDPDKYRELWKQARGR